MKKIVEVFPDYCSTGLWLDGCNVHPETVGVSDERIQLALKYWHEVWEFAIANENNRLSQRYLDRWMADGEAIAAMMSVDNEQYTFRYRKGTDY